MLESVLSFLRNDRRLEAMTLVDIASTLQLVADQFADMGHKVSYDGPTTRWPRCGPTICSAASPTSSRTPCGSAPRRRSACASRRTGSTIEVEDDGPGISDARKEDMLEPFVRGDDARNMDEAAGFGLGLSIANAIVLAHGGALSLHDRQPHGLVRPHPIAGSPAEPALRGLRTFRRQAAIAFGAPLRPR